MSVPRMVSPALPEGVRSEEIFARLLPELMAMPGDGLLSVNLDVLTAVTLVLGAMPRILSLRPDLVRACGDFDWSNLDRLPEYTWALRHAHTLVFGASHPSACPPAVREEAFALRDTLACDASTLARRGLVDGSRLRNVGKTASFRRMAMDLGILANVLKDSWSTIQGKSAVSQQELLRAQSLSEEFLRAASSLRKPGDSIERARDIRRRAFTLFYCAYEEVRAAVIYTRRGFKDGHRIAPPLRPKQPRKETTASSDIQHNSPETMADKGNSEPFIDAVAPAAPKAESNLN